MNGNAETNAGANAGMNAGENLRVRPDAVIDATNYRARAICVETGPTSILRSTRRVYYIRATTLNPYGVWIDVIRAGGRDNPVATRPRDDDDRRLLNSYDSLVVALSHVNLLGRQTGDVSLVPHPWPETNAVGANLCVRPDAEARHVA